MANVDWEQLLEGLKPSNKWKVRIHNQNIRVQVRAKDDKIIEPWLKNHVERLIKEKYMSGRGNQYQLSPLMFLGDILERAFRRHKRDHKMTWASTITDNPQIFFQCIFPV